MEEILRKLQKEASGSKHRAIKESCTWAIGKGRGQRRRAARGGAERGRSRRWRGFVTAGAGRPQQTCSAPAAEPPAAGKGAEHLGRSKCPGAPRCWKGPWHLLPVPESIRAPRLPHRLHLLHGSCEADTWVSVAVSFRVRFGGAVFSLKGPLPPLNHRKKTCSTVFTLSYFRESILKARSFVLLDSMSSFILAIS